MTIAGYCFLIQHNKTVIKRALYCCWGSQNHWTRNDLSVSDIEGLSNEMLQVPIYCLVRRNTTTWHNITEIYNSSNRSHLNLITSIHVGLPLLNFFLSFFQIVKKTLLVFQGTILFHFWCFSSLFLFGGSQTIMKIPNSLCLDIYCPPLSPVSTLLSHSSHLPSLLRGNVLALRPSSGSSPITSSFQMYHSWVIQAYFGNSLFSLENHVFLTFSESIWNSSSDREFSPHRLEISTRIFENADPGHFVTWLGQRDRNRLSICIMYHRSATNCD